MIIKLLVSALCNAALAILLYACDKKTSFGKLDRKVKQVIYGVGFGLLAIYSSTDVGGIDIGGAILNVRDSAPLCAGLVFGGPAGIIAGLIGGLYRYFATFLGLAGAYTQLACSVSTILTGFIAAALRKFMFDDKKPMMLFGMGIAMVCEVIHMLMIFVTNMNDPVTAFYFVKEASVSMILCNVIAVGLALLGVMIVSKDKIKIERGKRYIARTFQFWLFVCILIAFITSSVFTSTVQSRISESEAASIIETNMGDVYADISDASEEGRIDEYIGKGTKNRHVGRDGSILICDENLNIITEGLPNTGKNIESIGLDIEFEKIKEKEIFETGIRGEKYLCAYQFVEGYYIIGLMPTEEAMYLKEVSTYIYAFMKLVIFAALFILIYFLVKKIVLDNLLRVNSKLAEITNGDLDVKVDVRSNEEFASLSDDINSTVGTLKKYIAEAEARIDKELEFAKQIQYSSLPSALSPREEFEIYAEMHTAKEVGGDFYDYYMIGDSRIAFLIADVSGKGIPAAMFMMRAKAIIKDLAEQGLEPDEIFTAANEKLCENNEASMFVTAWLGILDLKTGTMKYANAGHNPPLIFRNGCEFEYLRIRSGFILAAMEGIKYRKNELQLMPGDKIYLYTDGVTEAENINGSLYGEDRLLELLNDLREGSPAQLCNAVIEDIDDFSGDASQFDDITMLSIKLKAIVSEGHIKVIPDADSRAAVDKFTGSLIGKLEILPKIADRINIIFDEIYSNIMFYSKATMTDISYTIDDGQLTLMFIDNGRPYDPLTAEEPDITLDIEEREIGGLGIFMVKKMAKDIEYKYENEENILKIMIALSE